MKRAYKGTVTLWRFGGLGEFWAQVYWYIHIYQVVYGQEKIAQFREIASLSRSFQFVSLYLT